MLVSKGYVEVSFGQVHYRRVGDRGPWLFLFHQSPLSSKQFELCLPYLGKVCRAVALDTPGYGNSDIPRKPKSLSEYGVQLLEAIDALGAEKFSLAGFHTGAGIALEIASILSKERLTKIILTGVPFLSSKQLKTLLANIALPNIREDGTHLSEEWLSRFSNWGDGGGLQQVHVAVTEALSVYPRYRWAFEALQKHEPESLLRSVQCPILYITSSRDSLRQADSMASRLCQNARTVNLGSIPPQIPWTAPQLYASAIIDFLAG
jgi:pimeloyl-ACP methyl ester carboxylesterase